MAATVEISQKEGHEVKTIPGTDLVPMEAKHELKRIREHWESLEVTITNEQEYIGAGDVRSALKDSEKEIKHLKKIHVMDKYYEPYKQVSEIFKHYDDFIQSKIRSINKAISDYDAEQERIRLEEQCRLDAKAERERKKAEERAERERKKAEEYASKGRDDLAEKALARAENAEMSAAEVITPVVERVTNTSASVSFREQPECVIEDHNEAVKALADNPALAGFLTINTADLAKMWKAGGKTVSIPGLTFKINRVPVSKRR